MNNKYIYLFPLLFSALSLHAQQACLDFEDFPTGPAFGPVLNTVPGDTLFEQDGLLAIAGEILYLNGNTGFGNASIESSNVGWLDGNFLFMGNNTLELHYPEGVQQVCFDFFDGGGEENFAVNGSDVAVISNFPDLAGMDFPGVDIAVSPDSMNNNTFLAQGTVCITGEVFSLTVGGQEFGVDNVCATPIDEPNPGDCLEFEMMDTLGYGAQAGTPPGTVFYTESDVAMRLAPVQTLFWSSVYGDLRVRQAADFPDFTQASGQLLEFASINSIYDFTAYPEPVEQITVDYYYTPDGDGTVNFAANGAALLIQFVLEPGFYALAPGITLEVVPDNNVNSSGQLVFKGNVQSLLIGGVSGLHIDNVCINPPPPCDLQELMVEAGDCNPNGVFEVTIDIAYDGSPADTLQLFTNGNYQLYAAGDFPLTLPPFIAPTNDIEFKVAAFGQPDCFLTEVLPAQDCGSDCTLESLVLEAGPECIPGDDIYTVYLFVEGADVGDTLTISAQQTNYIETVVYNGQQLNLDLPVPAEQFEVLQVCDLTANADCCKEVSYDVGCADCVFDNLSIEYLPCDGDSLFYFELNFDAVGNIPGESFKVETSNGYLETYAYDDLPVTVGPVLGYGEPVTVWVYDTEGDCGASQTIITPDCGDGCVLEGVNLLIPAAGCNNDGTYNIPMTVGNAQNGDVLKVTSLATGYAETLTYGEPFPFNLQLSGWPSPGFGADSLSICFANQPDCCTYIDFEVPCDPVDCGLEAVVEVIGCQPNGVLTLELTTNSNTPNSGPFVMIKIGDFNYGLFGINSTVEVGSVINPGTDELIVFVEQWGNPSPNSMVCEVEVPIDVSNCNPNCDIPGFEVFPEGCTGIFGSYSAFIDLDEAALDGTPIDIYVNGDLRWSEYTGGDLSLDIWAINPGDVQDVVSICYSNNPECCISKGVDALPCYCSDILDIVAEAMPCDGGSYYVVLDLGASDFGDIFTLEVDGAFYGSYSFSELPLTIGPFEGTGAPLNLFAYPDGQCQPAETSIETPFCNQGCDIEAVFADPTDCNDEGEYNLVLDLAYSGVPTSFEVFIPELGYSEVYGLNDFPVTIPGLPGDGATYQVNIVATDCNAFSEKLFDAPACNVGCIFNNVIAEPHPCEDGDFLVDIEVLVNDPGDLGYFIFADGEIFGPYDYNEPLVTLGPFAGDGVTVYDFLLLDFANPTCFGYVEVGPKSCATDCLIEDVTAEFAFCDEEGFYVELDFLSGNQPENGLYKIFGNGEVYDTLSYGEERPVVVGPFDPFTDNIYELIVEDLSGEGCSGFTEFVAFDCPPLISGCLPLEDYAPFESPAGAGEDVIGAEPWAELTFTTSVDNEEGAVRIEEAGAYPGFDAAEGKVVSFSQATLGIVLEPVTPNAPPRTLTIDYFEAAADSLLISIGADFEAIYFPFFDDEVTLENGITLSFEVVDFNKGRMIFSGPVEELYFNTLTQHARIAFDNICVGDIEGNSCAIVQASAETNGCSGGEAYDLTLDFVAENPGNDFFDLYNSSGELLDFYSLAELPVTLEGYGGGTGGADSVKVCINDQPDCCKWVSFEVPDCMGLDGACLDFEPFAGFQSPPADGAGELQEVGTQGGVFFGYSLGDFCLCSVEVTDSESLDFFDAAEGQVVEFYDAELYFDFSESAEDVTFDYSLQETDIYLTLDGFNTLILLDTLPENTLITLPNGNTIKRVPYTNNNDFFESSRIFINGEVTEMRLLGSGFLDNLCWSPATQEVWPGDANADNLAHHIDLLSIGLGYGVSGPVRADQDNSWSPTVAMDWDSTFANGTNYKHADCNGDGIIDEADRTVLVSNYGLEHGIPEPITELPGTDLDPPAFIDFPTVSPNGATFQAPVIVGSMEAPVNNAYGVAFTVQFDPEVISPDEVEVVYPTSWFGEPEVNTLAIDKVYPDGRIEIALTRIDHNNVSGHGQVAYIIGIIDDIAGLTSSEVSVEKTFCIDLEENRLPVQGRETTFKIVSSEEPTSGSGVFRLFPNPATDWVNIVSPYGFEADRVQLLNMNGQELPVRVEDNRSLSLENLPSGVYLVRITTGRSIIHKRVIKE